MNRPYVICPEKITSPYPDYGLPPNVPCGCKCPVAKEAEAMSFRCPRGHYFYATPQDVRKEGD